MSHRVSLEQVSPASSAAVIPEERDLVRPLAALKSPEILRLVDCDAATQRQWQALRQASPMYRSPFFSFDFLRSVADVGLQVEAAIQIDSGQLVCALPFQRQGRRVAMPVGLGINDAHGFLKRSDHRMEGPNFLQQCGLSSYHFHAAPPELCATQMYAVGSRRSFLADLKVDPRGYEHYLKHSSDTIDRQGQKTRKLIRKSGPLRLDFDCRDPRMIDLLIKLKSEQYRRTHTFDILAVDWIQRLLRRLHAQVDSPVRGILNVLFAGDEPVALHYGLVETDLLHYWFPVYDPLYAYGSPGTVLFLEIARQAEERGFVAIDMGYGEQPYKHKLTNVITEMSYGLVDGSPLRRAVYRAQLVWQGRVKKFWLKDIVKPIVRKVLPNLGADRFGG